MAANILTYHPDQAGGAFRATRMLRDLFDAMREGMAVYRRYQTLSARSDRELARAGLDRADLVREAVFPSGR